MEDNNSTSSTVDPLNVAITSLQAVAQIFFVLAFGVLCTRMDILSRHNARYLATLSVNLLLPCLTVVKIAETFTFPELKTWWPLLFFAVAHAIIGYSLGHIVRLVSKEGSHLDNSVVISCLCGNHGVIPLALLASVCADGPLRGEAECGNKDAYIFLYTTVSNFIMWSYGYYFMLKGNISIEPCTLEMTVVHGTRRHAMSATSETCEEKESTNEETEEIEESKQHLPASAADRDASVTPCLPPLPANTTATNVRRTRGDGDTRVAGSGRRVFDNSVMLRQIMSPPAIASIMGLLIGGTPLLREAFVGDGAPLRSVTRAMSDLGGGAIPLLMLVLAQSLSRGPANTGQSETAVIRRSTIFFTSVSRLVLMPAIGLVLLMFLDVGGVLPNDRVMKFVLAIEGGVPSALSLVSISQLAGLSEKSTKGISTLLFWQYAASIVSSTVMCCVFLAWVMSA